MNLHLLFTHNAAVAANMLKLLDAGDTIVLLDDARALAGSNAINSWPCDQICLLEDYVTEPQEKLNTISTQQWVKLSESAALIHSWY